jgi:hypothetical protein
VRGKNDGVAGRAAHAREAESEQASMGESKNMGEGERTRCRR